MNHAVILATAPSGATARGVQVVDPPQGPQKNHGQAQVTLESPITYDAGVSHDRGGNPCMPTVLYGFACPTNGPPGATEIGWGDLLPSITELPK